MIALAATALLLEGCKLRCDSQFDCGIGSFCNDGRCEVECFTHEDCRNPPDCKDKDVCEPRGLWCSSSGRCQRAATPPPATIGVDLDTSAVTEVQGWDLPPGSGPAFVVSDLSIASEDEGVDVDHACRDASRTDCLDNILHDVGTFANSPIQQGLQSGATSLLFELAGLPEPYVGNVDTFTMKIYSAHDATNTSADNFEPLPQESECCEYDLLPGTERNLARMPVKITNGAIKMLATSNPVSVGVTLGIGRPPYKEIHLADVQVFGRVRSGLAGISRGLIAGAIPVSNLAGMANEFCRAGASFCGGRYVENSTMLDLIAGSIMPDIDLSVPRNGVGSFELIDGKISRCLDAVGGDIPPVFAGKPDSCALDPRMEDGYSIAFKFEAVPARIVGFAE